MVGRKGYLQDWQYHGNKIILQENLCSDSTAQSCNHITGTRIIKVLHPHPTMSHQSTPCLIPSSAVWPIFILGDGSDSTCIGPGVRRGRESKQCSLSSRFVLSLQQNTRAEQVNLYVLQGTVDHREFKDCIAPSWKVPY